MKPQNIGSWHRSPGTALLLPEAWLALWQFKVAELKVHNGYSCFEVLFLSSLVPIMQLRSRNHHVSGWSSRHSVCESWVSTRFTPVVGLLRGHLVFKKRYIFSSSKPLTHNVWSLRWKGEMLGTILNKRLNESPATEVKWWNSQTINLNPLTTSFLLWLQCLFVRVRQNMCAVAE